MYKAIRICAATTILNCLIVLLCSCSDDANKDNLKSSTQFTIMTEELPPFNYTENGKTKGSSVDTLLRIMADVNIPVKRSDIHFMKWPDAYKKIQEEPKTILFSMARTAQREKMFKWVGPIAELKLGVLALKKNKFKLASLEDIRNYKIGTVHSGLKIM